MSNKWYVITGGPSTGKTTLLAELEKLGHTTLPEAARVVIDEALAKGISVAELRKDEQAFQDMVTRMKVEVESRHPSDVLTFFDRGMHDTLAYMRAYEYEIADWIKEHMAAAKYQKVFLLQPLGRFEKDYARTEDAAFTQRLHQLLHDAYAEYGMKPIEVPVLPPAERAQFILSHV